MTSVDLMFALFRCEIAGRALTNEEKSFASFEKIKEAFLTARSQDLGHLVYHAAKKNGLLSEPETESDRKFIAYAEKNAMYALARYLKFENEIGRIRRLFDEEKIPYVFLKGSELRSFYPEPWMRTSCDIDVLIGRENMARAAKGLEKIGYKAEGDVQYHDLSLFCGDVHLELHHTILEDSARMDPVLETVWDHTVKGQGSEYKMTPAFFVFHQIAHAAYHYIHGGCTVRMFLDLWLLRRRLEYQEEEVRALCREAGLETFFLRAGELAQLWFSGGEMTKECLVMQEYILHTGEFAENKSGAREVARKGRARWILSYVFVPYGQLKESYPALEKHKILLPWYQVRRWIDRLKRKKGAKALRRIIRVGGVSDDTVKNIQSARACAGLDFRD